MNFITKIRALEANGYGVWKSHIKKKWEDDEARRTVELNSVQAKMENVRNCENPAIARAFTRMVEYQGKGWQLTVTHFSHDFNSHFDADCDVSTAVLRFFIRQWCRLAVYHWGNSVGSRESKCTNHRQPQVSKERCLKYTEPWADRQTLELLYIFKRSSWLSSSL